MNLIREYIACSKHMCDLLKKNYAIKDETLLRARRINLIPKEGITQQGYYFNFHGGGCYFKFGNGSNIDVDLGPNDRCDGFDSKRLYDFMQSSNKNYSDLGSFTDIEVSLQQLLNEGKIVNPEWFPNPHLFYLKEKL